MKPIIKISVIVILISGTAIYLPSCKKEATQPVVTTTSVSIITQTSALAGVTLTDDGGAEVTAMGVCWSTSPNPTTNSIKKSFALGIGSFAIGITGLTPNTKYYLRAYATNSAGTSYGNELFFATLTEETKAPEIELATLTTTEVTSVTSNTAVSGGNITADGGGFITERGVCWSTYPNPTINNYKTTNEAGSGSFISYLVGLNSGITYYVRAYAVNIAGIVYGNQLSFIASIEPGGTGIRKADFPPAGGRYQAAGFSIGTKIYLGLGYDWDDNNQNDLWEYDPATNGWTQKADFPGNFTGKIGSFAIGTKGYIVVLNYNYININSSTNDLWEYNPATNGWTQKVSLPNIAGLGVDVAFSIGTKGYVGSGYDDALHGARDFWEWDQATNAWTEKDDYPGNTTVGAVSFSIGTKGYIGTGHGYGYTVYKDFWEWDQATNVWTKKADFKGSPRGDAVGFSIGDKAYIGTGRDGSLFKDFWEWDQETNVWTQKANFGGIERSSAVGFSIGNKGYIGTGIGSGFGNEYAFKDLWEYDPNLK